ncbi:multidrug resistance protein 1 [Aulographum hederae CBS 113979]|uniref:Multidrug resistance protein 1 n=1 Tax=Aulographum hederae CBS 113979 TaxID=1176131 RepID=A0A6G1H758_9PEZI|nr:multidrug resistance protein 1 [Aulographum hederae CBS 113979]
MSSELEKHPESEADAKEKSGESEGGLKSYFRVFHYADRISWTLNVIAFLAAIGAGTLLPLMDLFFGKFVTSFTNFGSASISPEQFRSRFNEYTLIFIYLFAAKFVASYVHTVAISVSAIRTTKALRIHFLERTLRQNIAFFESSDSGSISIQATTNGNNVNQGISEKLTLTIQSVSTFVAAFVVAFAVQWKLTLITISVVPTIVIISGISIAFDTKNEARLLNIQGKAGKIAEEAFVSMQTVHAFWLQPWLSSQYESLLDAAKKEGMKKSPNYAVLFSTEFFCVLCGYALAFWQGTRMYHNGEITDSGEVITVIFAVILAASSMTQIAPQILAVTKASSAAGELFKTIDRESEIDPLSNSGIVPEHSIGQLEVKDLHFSYPSRPDAKILKGMSITIPAGKTTALVGPSGSGKSTIIGLLERWYDQKQGTVLLDGVDLRQINLQWLRTNIRLVQQEPVLFNSTVLENVAFGLTGTPLVDASAEKRRELVKEACVAAFADEFIQNLPEGYDTEIGERAMKLSGGQKQRLAIARSIISHPKILLLDEATSALDPKAEKKVQQALENVSRGRTTLVIAHKLSTIRNADSIAVMADGRFLEQGTHESLIAANGAYARLVRVQDLGQGSSDDDVMNESVEHKMALDRTISTASALSRSSATDNKKSKAGKEGSMNYSLLRCLLIVFTEHKALYLPSLISFVGVLIGGLTFPAQAILFSRTINAFQLDRSEGIEQGDFYSLMFFIVALANLLGYALIGWESNIVAQLVARKYRLEVFQNIIRQDLTFFDKGNNTVGTLAAHLSTYPSQLHDLVGFNIMLIMINLVNIVSSCILALIVGWKLALVVIFGGLVPVVFSGYLRIRLETKLDDDTSARFDRSGALAAESVSAIRTIASLALERSVLERYSGLLSGVASQSMKALIFTFFWYSLTQSISFLAMTLGFWYGGRLVSTGEYSTTQFFIVFIGVIFSGEAAATFFSFTTSFTKGQKGANYIFWLRSCIPAISEDFSHKEDGPDGQIAADIDCKDLEFCYPLRPKSKILKGVSVKATPGQYIALVGASGCGKSTMISLLERFYDPTAGTIRLDSRPITSICPRQYRRNIALVQQEPVLYHASIRDNVAMGLASNPTNVTDQMIEEACRQANIFDFAASLPEGLNTLCGSRGSQLSGGQKQRIAIARALIRKPRLLLLDEATSALDSESEMVVQEALEKAKEGRTTVAVAHRLSTIRRAESILVFEGGRVVEEGTHEELIAKRGWYYEMCLGQSLDRAVA